jgi:hypothetical protein
VHLAKAERRGSGRMPAVDAGGECGFLVDAQRSDELVDAIWRN